MSTIVTLDEAKQHLRRLTPAGDPSDADLQLKIDQAEAIIQDYCEAEALDPTDLVIKAAILLELAELDRWRGDDAETQQRAPADGYLIPIVTAILHRRRPIPIA